MKVTVWNLKHADRLVEDHPSADMQSRITRIRNTVQAMDPDVLCIVEGPKGEAHINSFCTDVLNDQWRPVLLPGHDDGLYKQKGTQWIWFLVKPGLLNSCRLQMPELWQEYTQQKTWRVNFWGKTESKRHSHYRHPQVMLMDIGNGQEIEFIGVHLKSKINMARVTTEMKDGVPELTGEYLDTALEARTKLATEARDIRRYIDYRFSQGNPGILMMGDCNDGPGLDYFEDRYLFFDLISNLEGQIMEAEKFFNHGLFDYDEDLRWTAKFKDPVLQMVMPSNYVETGSQILLDHMLMSQPMVNGSLGYVINAHAGFVEHEAFDRNNLGANSKTVSSDHRPVSIKLDRNN